jgi:PadR family transcriptional regulator PadR
VRADGPLLTATAAADLSSPYNDLLTIDKSAHIVRRQHQTAMARQTDLLQGTLDLLILKVLALGPLHGWGISRRLQQISGDAFVVTQGSLYPSLHRMVLQGLLDSSLEMSDTARRVKTYRLTAAGRKRLAQETRAWNDYSRAVSLVLETTSA